METHVEEGDGVRWMGAGGSVGPWARNRFPFENH
jgi:hypothetical protein